MSDECKRCLDTGWQDCASEWGCSEEGHGGYCSCAAGVERRWDDEGQIS